MQKTLTLTKSGSQLNVEKKVGYNLDNLDLDAELLPESFLFVQFETKNIGGTAESIFNNTGTLKINIPGVLTNHTITQVSPTDIGIPYTNNLAHEIATDDTATLIGSSKWIGKATTGTTFSDYVMLKNDSTISNFLNGTGGSTDPGVVYKDGTNESVKKSGGYVLALPFPSDDSDYKFNQIEFEFNNSAITQFDFLGLKKVTKLIRCTIGGKDYFWMVQEYVTVSECA